MALVKLMTSVTLVAALIAMGCGFSIYHLSENGGNSKPHIVLGCGVLALLVATAMVAWVKG